MKKLILLLVVSILFIIFGIYGILKCRKEECKDWNKGICPKCGKPLKHFDTDSQGGEGWCCNNCRYYTWVSYKKYVYKTQNQ
jgi:prepilin signal peptidase PulO-like enzyme (type II secretory pathway)